MRPAAEQRRGSAPPPAPPARWFSAITPPQGDILTPPFPEDPTDAQAEAKAASKLFPRAVWERPAMPTKVLYADQVVQGVLMQSVNSDIPGTVRIKVTEPVMDRWGQGQTLIPVDTTFLGKQDGQVNFAQSILPINVKMGIFPDGTAVGWNQGQVGDATGATGLPTNVDNHYLKLFTGIAASVLLNVGVRAPFGSTNDFQPSLPQEFAQQGAQGANQAGQDIIRRQFAVRPTLTQEWAYPVTLQFSENVSFQTPAVIIKK
jgi:type IV secretion system protein TrbI